jgi:hypothetical protein
VRDGSTGAPLWLASGCTLLLCRKAVEVDSKDALAHRYLAKSLYGTGDLSGALSHFEQAIERSSDAALTHELMSERAACERDLRVQKSAGRPLRPFGLWGCLCV